MNSPQQIRPGTIYRAVQPVRDPLYRRFIKSLPCVACLRRWWVDPCHTGPHGVGQKSCDMTCIPLCRKHHQEYDAAPVKFAARYKLDIPALILMFNSFYQTKLGGGKAA